MAYVRFLRWWPPIGILAMVGLGVAVGRGSTPLDDWFIRTAAAHRVLRKLLLFTQPHLLELVFVVAVGFALYRRRWRLAAVVALTPVLGVVVVRLLKRVFGRERAGALAYPSGHVTVMVSVLGMVILVWGVRWWLVSVAVAWAVLGTAGQAFTYHYFTDTIGAIFLSTSLVCLAVWAAGLDRCQPGCDLRHSGG